MTAPLISSGRGDVGRDVLALPHVERQGALRDQREMVAAVVELRVGELLALMDGLHRVVEREPVLEELQRVGVAGGLVGVPSTAEISVVESCVPEPTST